MSSSGVLYVTGKAEKFGELGLHDTTQVSCPTVIPELEHESVIDVASGSLHSLAIDMDRHIWSWGCNDFGALGRTGDGKYPQKITHSSMRYIKFKKVACGNSISLAISTKNQLYAWGSFNSKSGVYGFLPSVDIQTYPRIINETAKIQMKSIAAGASHCLALDFRGNIYSWGCGEFNQLGYDTSKSWKANKQCLVPTKLRLQDIESIQCGAFHSIALGALGQVYTWGLNHFQQCGLYDPVVNDDNQPEVIVNPILMPFSQKKSPFKMTKVPLKPRGRSRKRPADEVLDNDDGEEGPLIVQIETSGEPRAVDIAAGDYHSLGLMSDNTLVVWGRCDNGQLGIPYHQAPGAFIEDSSNMVYAIGSPYFNKFKFDAPIKEIRCGSNHTLVVSKGGKVWGFGESTDCQLGIKSKAETKIMVPTLIQSIMEKGKVIHVAAGGEYSFFLLTNE